ncbi:snRNA-activating protein complex subunit 1 [Drosophila innubila]|uniref:snRNA-activating protein complex subunit 1 n=1 Tax=Drosophila innubila TaxID=198719 RepID=UPI00148B52DC|nr:snRNA-activating protein complex subunit 1 [Drosophila innubila]
MEPSVYVDCWQLIQRFGRAADESQDANFELFSQCWLEMQMQHIYSAQTNHVEVMETTMAALHVAKRVACGRKTNGDMFEAKRAQRIGGIYLLYAIYNKQPTKHFVKIEVSPRTWESLTSYVEQLRLQTGERRDTQQVSYIFWKLVQENAFLYTALDYCQALDALAAYDHLESIAIAKHQNNHTSALLKQQLKPSKVYLNEELNGLSDLASISKPLCQLQEAYNKQMVRHRSSFAATQIFSQLQDVFSEANDKLMGNKPPATTSEANDQLDVRKRVRQKAMFGEAIEAMSTDDEESEQPSPKPITLHERRMSSATVFEAKLPEDVLKNLQS